MSDIKKLSDRFGIEGELIFTKSENGFIYVDVANKFATSTICLYGAHVTSFKPKNSQDILWVSPESSFEIGKPIRGGIPVCFPWFGPHKSDPKKPQHGFGRLMVWDVVDTGTKQDGETFVELQLCSSDETKFFTPQDFCATINIVIGAKLEISLQVTNRSNENFDYSCALHTYYNVSDIEDITITGLQGAHYHSQLIAEPNDFVQESATIEIHQAETRHYHNTESPCTIDDPNFGRRISVAKAGSKITTVWNPWAVTCAQISDLPNDGYKTFVCIEAVNAFDSVISLLPGQSHTTSALIGLV
ncbi:MAG: D-hexose-6-phosphate mutarotase [Mariniphaga sp.]